MDLAPDQSKYDPTDERLRTAARILQDALDAKSLEEEEALWTQIIDEYSSLSADWVPDVVGRALGNRGNARSRRGDLMGALEDYNASIKLCPWSVDPVLNRGVALEALGRWDEAIRDYRAILKVAPLDPLAGTILETRTPVRGGGMKRRGTTREPRLWRRVRFRDGEQGLRVVSVGADRRSSAPDADAAEAVPRVSRHESGPGCGPVGLRARGRG